MLTGSRSVQKGNAASLRWRFLFWLFAVFAGIEAPLSASDLVRAKPSGISDTEATATAAAQNAASEVSTPLTKPADLAWLENGSADEGAPSTVAEALRTDSPVGQFVSAKIYFALCPAGFQSRAPPALA